VTRVLWFSARFLLLYALLQSVFMFTPVGDLANRFVASAIAGTLSVCMDVERGVMWEVEGRDIYIKIPVRAGSSWKLAQAELREGWYTRNIPMFLAIVLAASRTFRGRLFAILGFGTLGVILLDGLVGAAHAWATMPGAVPFTPAYHVLSVFGVWSLGGIFVAPIFVGAILALTFLGDPTKPAAAGPVGRNDPCPCGSGRKYKRCCGAKQAAVTHGA